MMTWTVQDGALKRPNKSGDHFHHGQLSKNALHIFIAECMAAYMTAIIITDPPKTLYLFTLC